MWSRECDGDVVRRECNGDVWSRECDEDVWNVVESAMEMWGV